MEELDEVIRDIEKRRVSPELEELAKKALANMAKNPPTEEEIIAAGVAFICDTSFGGE